MTILSTEQKNTLDLSSSMELLAEVLRQDVGSGDITTDWTVEESAVDRADVISKEEGVIAGIDVARAICSLVDKRLQFEARTCDGEKVSSRTVLCTIEGPTRAILTAERTLLNFMQRMSGIATMAYQLRETVKKFGVTVVDTRKTAPGLRYFDKYSVRAGGAQNHRIGLYDVVLIKENHIAACKGPGNAIRKAQAAMVKAGKHVKLEIEVTNVDELKECLECSGVDLILLDNMSFSALREAVALRDANSSKPVLEASGNITLENAEQIAATGIDRISVGALTHSVKALDLSLLLRTS